MSRSQGAANGGWPHRYPAGEPDPRTGGRPAQRPQAPAQSAQPHTPQYPAYANPNQAPSQANQGYGEPQATPPSYNSAPAYHYPQQQPQSPPQHPHVPQYSPQTNAKRPGAPGSGNPGDVPRTAPPGQAAHQQVPRGLSSLDSARGGQAPQDFDNYPRTQPPYAAPQGRTQPPQQRTAPAPQPPAAGRPGSRIAAADPHQGAPAYRQASAPAGVPQYAPRTQQEAAPSLRSPSYDQWPPAQQGGRDASGAQGAAGYDLGAYLPGDSDYPHAGEYAGAGYANAQADAHHQDDWSMSGAAFGDPAAEQPYPGNQFGYDQPRGAGALEPVYGQDQPAEFEQEEPRRRSWTMRIAGAVVVAIGLGYGLAQAYKAVLGPAPDGAPPVIESDASPTRERPTEPGGREFAHTDSKVLGRLSENDSDYNSNDLSDADANSGARKVSTLVVGRDGSIAPPAAEPASQEETVSVPGLMVVDAFGGGQSMPMQRQAGPPPQEPEPVVMNAPAQRSGVNVKSTKVIPAETPPSTASLPDERPAPPAAPKKQRVAAAPPVTPPATTASTGTGAGSGANGYVAVLASVPASATSRLDALRKFADMQQQYGMVLGNKTPDVRETNLAGKGPYHRLLVGPPGSRSQASELCTQLKASGYSDCWVTAY